MSNTLTQDELCNLVKEVFPRLPGDKRLTVLVDLPDDKAHDNPQWSKRREMAAGWTAALRKMKEKLRLERIELMAYRNVGSNNADFPDQGYRLPEKEPVPATNLFNSFEEVKFDKVLSDTQLILAPTQFSATAPLKVAAKKFGFRAATMPGFCAEMIPALRIDYGEVNRLCILLKEKLDRADSATVTFRIDNERTCQAFFDLRFRKAHASSGRFPDPGTAGNLPSGETYIVPYEGELDQPSKTKGTIPVQFDDGIVFYEISENKARSVNGEAPAVEREAKLLAAEPAYGNIGEFAFGVLADFGLNPIGKILLDEKLGFHIAFGRSDHFGGAVGPSDFSSPDKVVHIDRVYIPETQPRVVVERVNLEFENGQTECLMEHGEYVIF